MLLQTALDVLQWPGMALGLAGAVLVARRTNRARRWGFVLWICSNVCWIAFSAGAQTWGLLIMQSAFLATSCMGWWSNRHDELVARAIADRRHAQEAATIIRARWPEADVRWLADSTDIGLVIRGLPKDVGEATILSMVMDAVLTERFVIHLPSSEGTDARFERLFRCGDPV